MAEEGDVEDQGQDQKSEPEPEPVGKRRRLTKHGIGVLHFVALRSSGCRKVSDLRPPFDAD